MQAASTKNEAEPVTMAALCNPEGTGCRSRAGADRQAPKNTVVPTALHPKQSSFENAEASLLLSE